MFSQDDFGNWSLADARRAFQYGAKHKVQVAGRAGYDLENFRGRRELFQRLVALSSELRIRGLGGTDRAAMALCLCRILVLHSFRVLRFCDRVASLFPLSHDLLRGCEQRMVSG